MRRVEIPRGRVNRAKINYARRVFQILQLVGLPAGAGKGTFLGGRFLPFNKPEQNTA
jgi:hypothetical protein